jgi:hypothetical protein
MKISPNVIGVAKEFIELFECFNNTYFVPLIQTRLPSKSATTYIVQEIESSQSKIKRINLGKF